MSGNSTFRALQDLMTESVRSVRWQQWTLSWDAQQAGYVADLEDRLAFMLDVLQRLDTAKTAARPGLRTRHDRGTSAAALPGNRGAGRGRRPVPDRAEAPQARGTRRNVVPRTGIRVGPAPGRNWRSATCSRTGAGSSTTAGLGKTSGALT